MRNTEYDRFGPWVVEINEEDLPSPLFLPYLTTSKESLISVKIPRKISRRNAHPGMDLYDYLITLFDDEMQILQRVDDQVQKHTIGYKDLQYIRFSKELLKGTLFLQLPEQAFDIRFNTVSERIMRYLVDQIRRRYCAGIWSTSPDQTTLGYDHRLSFYFKGLLDTMTSQDLQLRVLALQSSVLVGQLEQSRARRLFYGVISKTLLESMHFCDGRELIIIDRGRTYKYGWQSIYGSSTYSIPLDRIQGSHWEPDRQNSALTNLALHLAGSRVNFTLLAANPALPTYAGFLSTPHATPHAL